MPDTPDDMPRETSVRPSCLSGARRRDQYVLAHDWQLYDRPDETGFVRFFAERDGSVTPPFFYIDGVCAYCDNAPREETEPDTTPEDDSEVSATVECEQCGESVPPDETTEVRRTTYCGACADEHTFTCERCMESETNTRRYDVSGEMWCADCTRDYSFYCDECDTRSPEGSDPCCASDDDGDDDDGDAQRAGLHNYGYKPRAEYVDVRNGKVTRRSKAGTLVYFGVELEVECESNSSIAVTREILAHELPVYCKEDGSLDHGVEIVSHPATLAAWRSMRPQVEAMARELRAMGVRSYNTTTCGLHIHVSRAALNGTAHLYKVLALVFHNPQFIRSLSRRASLAAMRQYASLEEPVANLPRKAKAAGTEDTARYSAVNVQGEHTVEFRFFRGTLAPDGIYRALESCAAIVDFTRDVTLDDARSVQGFRKYVAKNKKAYPTLAAWLANANATLEPTNA